MTPQVLEAVELISDPRVKAADELPASGHVVSENPATGRPLAAVKLQSRAEYDHLVQRAAAAQVHWRQLPAPKRGEIVRLIGNAFREQKDALGTLVTLECGKIKAEGDGEIQECIDIADFAVGLSRQLYG